MPEALLTEALLTLEEVKLYIGETSTDRDELITRKINYATGQMESHVKVKRKLKSRASVFTLDGTGELEIYAPEYPVTALASAEVLDVAGVVERALDITGCAFDSAGLIALRAEAFPKGTRNIKLTCTAGIVTTSAEWKALTGYALRWVQVMLADQTGIGRGLSMSIGGVQATADWTYPMPPDLEKGFVEAFKRVGW